MDSYVTNLTEQGKAVGDFSYGICQDDECSNVVKWDSDKLRRPQKYCSQECRDKYTFTNNNEVFERRRQAAIEREIDRRLSIVPPPAIKALKVGGLRYSRLHLFSDSERSREVWDAIANEVGDEDKHLTAGDRLELEGWTFDEYISRPGQFYSLMLSRKIMRCAIPGDLPLEHLQFNTPAKYADKPSQTWPYTITLPDGNGNT